MGSGGEIQNVPNGDVVYEIGAGFEDYFEVYKDESGKVIIRPRAKLIATDWQHGKGPVMVLVERYRNGPVIQQKLVRFQFPQQEAALSDGGGGILGKPWLIILLAVLLLVIIVVVLLCILYKRRRGRRGSYQPKHWESERYDRHNPTRPPYYFDIHATGEDFDFKPSPLPSPPG